MNITDENGKCRFCGLTHAGACPAVKSVDFYENGAVKHVEYREVKPTVGVVATKPWETQN